MAANVKNHVRRANLITTPIGHLAEAHLSIQCGRCRLQRTVPVRGYVDRYGGQHLLGDLLNRVVCGDPVCRAIPGIITLHARGRRVILLGPGAFE